MPAPDTRPPCLPSVPVAEGTNTYLNPSRRHPTNALPEYPDTIVERGLAKEGLADWDAALSDYNKAIALWGGGRGEGVNPFVLTFRGLWLQTSTLAPSPI